MRTRHLTAAGLAAAALALGPLAGTAVAHVTVQSPGATQGGFAKLAFRTPTERDVPTTKLEIAFPAEHPLAFVNVRPLPGWTYQVVKAAPAQPFEAFGEPVTEVVTRIVWTATGDGIKPGEFEDFEVSVGPLPRVDSLVFKALQTYRGGEVVRWIETPVAGGPEPEHPAPVLTLAAAQPTASPHVTHTATGGSGSDGNLSLAALGVASLALVTSVASLIRGRRPRPAPVAGT